MQKYMIVGGNRLQGKVRASGSKNASLPILAASLLGSGESVIHDVPNLKDVSVMMEVLQCLGAGIRREGNTVCVDAKKIDNLEVSEELMRKMRASNLVLGPLLARFKKVTISHPGGQFTSLHHSGEPGGFQPLRTLQARPLGGETGVRRVLCSCHDS
ncbi:MAG: hypothetical protein K6T66_04410 [Peptococcaceae bacterium]|nr:hypothetical protein [Peptococcaceae bacterium]